MKPALLLLAKGVSEGWAHDCPFPGWTNGDEPRGVFFKTSG